jgi:fibronectin-binding autotransporter adhesin
MPKALPPARRFRPAVTVLEDRTTPATHLWTGGGATNNWSDAGNWFDGDAPRTNVSEGIIIVFNTVVPLSVQDFPDLVIDRLRFDAGADVELSLAQNLGLAGNKLDKNIIDETGTNAIVGAGDLTLSGTFSIQFVTNSPLGSLVVGADINGECDLLKLGAGTLAVTGTNGNTYGGATVINEGTLRVQTPGEGAVGVSRQVIIGAGFVNLPATLVLAGTGQLVSDSSIDVRSNGRVVLLPGAAAEVRSLTFVGGSADIGAGAVLTIGTGGAVSVTSGTAAVTGDGELRLNSGVVVTVADDPAAANDLLVATRLAGADLNKAGPGALAVFGANTIPGLTSITGGLLRVGTGADKVTLSRDGGTLLTEGSNGEDRFGFVARSGFYDVTVNGQLLKFSASAVTVLVFVGNGGADRTDLFTAGTGNTAGLNPAFGVLVGGTGYKVFVGLSMETMTVTGQPGDLGFLAGLDGNDVLVATPTYALMQSEGATIVLAGFGTVGAFGNGGTDTAYFGGSAGDDNFVATPTYAGMVGTGFQNFVAGFEGVVAVTGGGNDAAFLADSEAADTLVAEGNRATLTLPTVTVVVDGFFGVVAYGTNGGVNRKRVGTVGYFLDLPGVWVD